MRSSAILMGVVSFVTVGLSSAFAQEDGALVALHELRREGSSICLVGHYHYGGSSGETSRKAALESAVSYWRGFTAGEYGDHWGSWRRARNKTVNCEQTASGWGCGVEARPCKPLPRRASRR